MDTLQQCWLGCGCGCVLPVPRVWLAVSWDAQGSVRTRLLTCFPGATHPCSHWQGLELLVGRAARGDGRTASLKPGTNRYSCCMRVLAGDYVQAEPPKGSLPQDLTPISPVSCMEHGSTSTRQAPFASIHCSKAQFLLF